MQCNLPAGTGKELETLDKESTETVFSSKTILKGPKDVEPFPLIKSLWAWTRCVKLVDIPLSHIFMLSL